MDLSQEARRHVNTISARLSLRDPQRYSLELLARIGEIIRLDGEQDATQALEAIRSEFPSVEDFERAFPSLCFALATGVGKTRLMGAFVAYLNAAHGIRHFFVLAPNLTIYDKLIRDFTPGAPKYVLQGISAFAQNPPLIITGDTYESSLSVRGQDLFGRDERVHVNIFNISKLNKDTRTTGGAAPRIKRLSEYIGQSYFEYLAGLKDLVLLMDESHRYRAAAGVRVLNELRPVLGLELTATPQVERAGGAVGFKNVLYSYPLSNAIRDGYVKEPAVATRENFDVSAYRDREEDLERLKLEDGVRLHENTRAELDTFARSTGRPRVKPFMLVVAKDTTHADALMQVIRQDTFFGGQYRDRVIQVHSGLSGEEKDETIQSLLKVEDPDEQTEIVIHVNMLKEGWDVTNLYTIVPLRTANSRTLVEQSIGRGLRLPYGGRTDVPELDRLTIVSHDRFQEIIDHANDPNSIIRTGIVIGRDAPEARKESVTVKPHYACLAESPPGDGAPNVITDTPGGCQVAETTLQVLNQRFRALPNVEALRDEAVRAKIIAEVVQATAPVQPELPGLTGSTPDVKAVVDHVLDQVISGTISIPRIVVLPKGEVSCGFEDFDLDLTPFRFQPVDQNILVQLLQSNERHRLSTTAGIATEVRPEDYLVRRLIDYPDISYDHQADLLYKLAAQVVAHFRSYLSEEDVENVLQYYEQHIAENIHAQMQPHFVESATEYEVSVTQGCQDLKPLNFTTVGGEAAHFRQKPADLSKIRAMFFSGFRKCLYPFQKFDVDTERRFAELLEDDPDVLKWFRPVKGQFNIFHHRDQGYVPDFVVETAAARYLCETKAADDIPTQEVQDKARAAKLWGRRATEHEQKHGGKPWRYVLIPHDQVRAGFTFGYLAGRFGA